MKLIINEELLEDEEIQQLEKTPEGMKLVGQVKIATRIGFSLANLISYLANDIKALNGMLTYDQQNDMANILYHCLLKADQKYLDEYVEECYEELKAMRKQMPQAMGNC
jgi:hypothetical protein